MYPLPFKRAHPSTSSAFPYSVIFGPFTLSLSLFFHTIHCILTLLETAQLPSLYTLVRWVLSLLALVLTLLLSMNDQVSPAQLSRVKKKQTTKSIVPQAHAHDIFSKYSKMACLFSSTEIQMVIYY